MEKLPVTLQMIVKNEEQFVWYALASVLPYVPRAIIYDTGSSDKTVLLIKNVISRNPDTIIKFKECKISKATDITQLRQSQLRQTTTPWFLLVDGDEIWTKGQLLKLLSLSQALSKNKAAVVNYTRNCVGDIWHYLPDSFGKYTFLGKTGHFNIRLMRNLPFQIKDTYPNETYYLSGTPINQQDDKLYLSDAWYLHTTHLDRSSTPNKTFGRRKKIYSLGVKFKKIEIPEVIYIAESDLMPKVTHYRSFKYLIWAAIFDLIRKIIK